MDYMVLKHSHMMFAVLSIILFYTRAFLRIKQMPLAKNKVLFISSHSVDTLLLASAIYLAVMLGMSPHNQPWLGEKILLVVAYIITGVLMTKQTVLKGQLALLALASAILVCIFYLARFKTPFLF